MPEAPTCCSEKTPEQHECDRAQCTCGDVPCGENDFGEMLPGCGISYILKPIDPLQEGSYSRTRLLNTPSNCSCGPAKLLKRPSKYSKSPTKLPKSPSKYSNKPFKCSNSPSRLSNRPSKYSNSPARLSNRPSKYSNSPARLSNRSSKFSTCLCKRSDSPSKYSNESTTSTKTTHRLKLQLEVCTEQTRPQKIGVSMTCLVEWNIAKAVEKHPSIDLEKAIHDCQEKLDIEPCTGQYCLPRSLANAESEEDRHISCALLAWQAKGETDLDKLVDLAEKIRMARKGINETNITAQVPRKPSPSNQLGCPPNQLSRDQPGLMSCKPSHQSDTWHERKVTKSCDYSKQCTGTNADIVGPTAKRFYEGLAGPVIRLPDSCPCDFKEFPPEYLATKESNVRGHKASAQAPAKDGQGEKKQLDIPVCLEGKCMERLRALDQAVGTLRQRVARLAKREQERKHLLERAEKAWQEMERGFQDQLILANEKEEEITERINQLVTERNSFKTSCLCGETDLENQIKSVQAAEESLSQMISAIKQTEEEKQKLERHWKKLDADVDKEKVLSHNKQRELTIAEEHLRTRLTSLSEDLNVQQKLTADVNSALRKELESLKQQFNVVSKQLLEADDQNIALRAKLAQIKETKSEMTAALESCRERCDQKYDSVKKELEEKTNQLNQKKEEAIACSCKLPVDTACQVTRTPSFVAACRCTKPHSGKSCSCTSLKTRMMKDLVKDISEGMRDEIAEGTAMPCELLKCMEDDFDWNAGTPLKEKIRDFFEELLHNELDIAIMTAIEQYHARWTNDSCVDKPRKSKKKSKVIVMRVERTDALHLPTMTSAPEPPPSPRDLSPLTTDNENPWKRTQADVYQLSMELKQLKRKCIGRRDLHTMEQNLAKIVQNVVNPTRSSEADKATAMTPRSTDTFRPKSLYKTIYIPKSHEQSRERSSSRDTKHVAAGLKIEPQSTKLSLLKDKININPMKNAQNLRCVPKLNSTDQSHPYVSPKGLFSKLQKGSVTCLIKNEYLAANKDLGSENAPSTSKNKPILPPVYKNEFCKDNVPELLTKPSFAHQFSPEVFTIQNASPYREERKEKKARRETYNRLISECMQSFTREQTSYNSKNIILNAESVNVKEISMKAERHFNVKYSEISIYNGSGSFASWKTAQDEDISSLIESVYNSKTCITNKIMPLGYKSKSSTKTQASCNSAGAKKLESLNHDNVKVNTTNVNSTQYGDYNNSTVGVYFSNKLRFKEKMRSKSSTSFKSKVSVASSIKSKYHKRCAPDACDREALERKSKMKKKSSINKPSGKIKTSKGQSSKGERRKSLTSLKSNVSLASSRKSKYHYWCTHDSSVRDALERKVKLKKKSLICKPSDKSKTSKGQSNKEEQTGAQTSLTQSDINTKNSKYKIDMSSSMDGQNVKTDPNAEKKVKSCSCDLKPMGTDKSSSMHDQNVRIDLNAEKEVRACLCDLKTMGTDKSSSMDGQKVKTDLNFVNGMTACLCKLKSMGASLLREKNAERAYGGDRFGIGPFRGIFGQDQQPLGEAKKFLFECEEEAARATGKSSVQEDAGQAVADSISSDVVEQRGLLDEVTESGTAGSRGESGDDVETLATTDGGQSTELGGSGSNADSSKVAGVSKSSLHSGDAEVITGKSRSQSSIKRESCNCKDELSLDKRSVGIGSHKCLCAGSITSAQIQTSRKYMPSEDDDDDDDEQCVCCSKSDKQKSKDLETNAFQLLQQYILGKIKKMKCECRPLLNPDIDENLMYTNLLEKIQGVISKDIGRLACRCKARNDIENSEHLTFSLLEEYIKNKLEEIMCSCNGKHSDVSPDFYTDLLATIKNVIDNDLADMTCCCHSTINEDFNSKLGDIGSGVLNQNSVSDKMCETCFCDQTTQTSGDEVKIKSSSSKCFEGMKTLIGKISRSNLSSDREHFESKKASKETSGNRTSSKSFNCDRKSVNGNEVKSIWCKCLPDQYSSNLFNEIVSSSANLTSSKQNLTDKQDEQNNEKVTSDKSNIVCNCNQKDTSGPRISQEQRKDNSKQPLSEPSSNLNHIPVEKQKSSSRQSSPDLNSNSQKNSITNDREGSVKGQSKSAVISDPRVRSTESCHKCKIQVKNFCPVCKTLTSPDSPSEISDLLPPSQVRTPCGCDPNMKSCMCININQNQASHAMNMPYIPNSYGPSTLNGPNSPNMYGPAAMNVYGPSALNGYGLSAPNMYQPNALNCPAPNPYEPLIPQYQPNLYGPIDVNTIPQFQPNMDPGPGNSNASYIAATNGGAVPTDDYVGATLKYACRVKMEPCTCSEKPKSLDEASRAGRDFGGKNDATGGFVNDDWIGTNGARGSSMNGARGSAIKGSRVGIKQVQSSSKSCSTCKKKAERADKSSKPIKIQCNCSAKL